MGDNKVNPANRDRAGGGRFVKGQSGNPSGRPKVPEEFRELVRKATIPALQTVISIANDTKAKTADRIRAAEIIIERAYGKATQPIDLEMGGAEPIKVIFNIPRPPEPSQVQEKEAEYSASKD